jgi:hypothetical protein
MKTIVLSLLIASALCNFLPIKKNSMVSEIRYDFYDCSDAQNPNDGLDVKYVTISQIPKRNSNN